MNVEDESIEDANDGVEQEDVSDIPLESEESEEPASDEETSDTVSASESSKAEIYRPGFSDDELNEIVERVISPISADLPVGTDDGDVDSALTKISSLDEIQTKIKDDFGTALRNDALESFDISLSGEGINSLIEVAVDCLADKCKSLLVCANLPRLFMVKYGFEGFAAGVVAFNELLERYGEELVSREAAIGNVLRKGIYVGNDDNTDLNYMMFLVSPITHSARLPYVLLRNALVHGKSTENIERCGNDAQKSNPEQYSSMIQNLEHVVESAKSCNSRLYSLFDQDALVQLVEMRFIESIEQMVSIVRNLATDHCPGYPPQGSSHSDEAKDAGEPVANTVASTSGEIVNRTHAIELLEKIADFFYRTEKHSPLSYSLRQTVRWSKMDLPELWEELLNGDSQPLSELSKRVGFKSSTEEPEDTED